MSVLTRKLWRTVKTTGGQFLAVASVVMVGVIMYVAMSSVSNNVERSITAYYREYAFADCYFHVITAPESVVRRVRALPGVAQTPGFAMVYNASLITFSERTRELPALRVMGFTVGEVSSLLAREHLMQAVAGITLGLPFGAGLAQAYAQSATRSGLFATYTFQIVICPLTYLAAAAGGVLFAATAFRAAVRGIARLDLVEVLKTRD
ncbi:MAG: ABC transporter permease [Syntrophomonadaceae bacterium]|jgi:ABC-type antimicrobial peptide transport system permease subunit|nr:ABC transporter permease [Syntrophomonadaceae bacterium]MDH7498098.1 ABC transporter permease [Syntrophomonadaceae bacterium]